MALSEKEKDWLERRRNLCNRCGFQKRCIWKSENIPCEKWGLFQIKAWGTKSGYVEHNFRDTTEFNARVAVLLAKPRKKLRPKGCSWYEKSADGHLVRKTACPPHHDIDNCPGVTTCAIYHARLAAEAEIDNTAGER
ncbi:hypothetical protein AB9L11_11705 [Desulfovibrio piger]